MHSSVGEKTMAAPSLKNRSGAPVAGGIVDAFAGLLAGKALGPSAPDYESARRIWNAGIVRHPGLIVRCAGTADVVQAVKFARANDLLVAVRGGGHNVAGRALCDDGLVIHLSQMRAGVADPPRRTVPVQGGATPGDVAPEPPALG